MQDAKCKMQKCIGERQVSARVVVSLCILHLAFCITGISLSAQQQPGMPGSMGFSSGIVASNVPPQFKDVTFEQRLGQTAAARRPLHRTRPDATSPSASTSARKPVVLAFVYYQCPMLCTQVLNGISSALKVLPFAPGKDFDVVLVSFDPRDTPEAANAKKRAHLDHWAARGTANGWHFLTGDEASIRQVTAAAGFTYQWDAQTQQFAHVSGLLVATADGTLSRYFYGVEYSPRDLRLALIDSGNGKVGSVDRRVVALLLPVRPVSRSLWCGVHEHHAARRRADRVLHRGCSSC